MKFRASTICETTPWEDLSPGAEIYEPATSRLFLTGDWRTEKPVFAEDRCRHCMLCVPYCPDSSIPVSGGKRQAFDMDHCKGCGICAEICPFEAIRMEKEGEE